MHAIKIVLNCLQHRITRVTGKDADIMVSVQFISVSIALWGRSYVAEVDQKDDLAMRCLVNCGYTRGVPFER